ncbi:MAG: response regulator [Bacteriovoracaceae bacterium]|nr:response regulator [Bacteriovoracaceae bacterium]
MMQKRRTTILVIEDEDIVRDTIVAFLKEFKMDVVPAADGLLGVQKASRQEFDLIITDVNLPKLRGDRVVKEIRKDETNADTPIIMLSAYLNMEIITNVKDMISKALVKPIEMDQLLKEVEELLK